MTNRKHIVVGLGELLCCPPESNWVEGGGDSGAGEVEYTYEIAPTHLAEDKMGPDGGSAAVSAAHVHHAVVYIRPPDSA